MIKSELFDNGYYSFPPPGVTTSHWGKSDWIGYIDHAGVWMGAVTSKTKFHRLRPSGKVMMKSGLHGIERVVHVMLRGEVYWYAMHGTNFVYATYELLEDGMVFDDIPKLDEYHQTSAIMSLDSLIRAVGE